MSPEIRVRFAFVLIIAATLAYLFYYVAFDSWFWWAYRPRVRWLVFQDWRWWVGALATFCLLLFLAGLVMSGDKKTRSLPTTPLEDPTHRIRVDAEGNEIEPAPVGALDAARTAPVSYAPDPREPVAAMLERSTPSYRLLRRRHIPWSWALMTITAVVLTSIYSLTHGAGLLPVLAIAYVYTLLFLCRWLIRLL